MRAVGPDGEQLGILPIDQALARAQELGIDEEGVPFHVKKEVTSALRRLAPTGLSTDILWTANARTLRHVIEMRTAPGAEVNTTTPRPVSTSSGAA